jgi:hypothetical protein
MFRVLSAPIIRSTIKTVDAVIGTVHASFYLSILLRAEHVPGGASTCLQVHYGSVFKVMNIE